MTDVEKEIRQQQKERLKKMTTKEKAAYLWTYYKWYLIGFIFIVVFLALFTRDILNGRKPSYIYAVMINTSPGFEAADRLIPDLSDLADADLSKYRITIDSSMYISDAPVAAQINMGSEQKLIALYAAREIDALTAPESVIEQYLKAGLFADPYEILGPDQMKKLSEAGFKPYLRKKSEVLQEESDADDKAFEKNTTSASDDKVCLGLVINNSSYLKEIGAYSIDEGPDAEPIVYVFSSVSDDTKSSVILLELLTNLSLDSAS